MSLDWDLRGIANHETVCWVPTGETKPDGSPRVTMKGVTNAIIWATIFVDIGRITEKNYREFYARIQFFVKLRGPFCDDGDLPTLEDVKQHVGLRTNVADLTTAQFMKRIGDLFMREQRNAGDAS